MPDDTPPEQPPNAPSGAGADDAGTAESWDQATQAVPAQGAPADVTQSMAGNITPPVGTPVTTPADGVGAAAGTAAPGPRARTSSQRAWLIAVAAAAVLLAGAGIA